MFNPYEEADDYAGAKGCFKCGNPYGDPVYIGRSSQPIGCTACCQKPKEKRGSDKVTLAILELCLKNGWGDKKKILKALKKEKEKANGSLL